MSTGGHVSAESPLRVGVVGVGDIATKAYLPVLARRPDLALTLLSRNPERGEQVGRAFGIDSCVTRMDDLLDRGIQAAFVHASTDAHAELVTDLLTAGVHVLVDKPLAPTLADAQGLVQLAEDVGRSLAVGFNRRHSPVYAALARLPRSVVLVQKNRVDLPDEPRRVVFDDFIHVVDTLRFLGSGEGTEERVDVRCVVADGRLRTVTLGLQAGSVTGVGIMNRVSGSNEEVVEVLGDGHKHRVVDMASTEAHRSGGVQLRRRGDWTPVQEQRGFTAMCAWFLAAVREERILSARDALRTHEVCEDVVRAAEAALRGG
jgi:virulence factor